MTTDGGTDMDVSFCVSGADCCACFSALNLVSLLGSVFKYEKTVAVFVVLICGRYSPQHELGADAPLATSKEFDMIFEIFLIQHFDRPPSPRIMTVFAHI
jgi:hypothetical protein